MMTVGVLMLVVHATDSVGFGGLTSAAVGIGVVIAGPVMGDLVDRHGQRRVLVPVGLANGILLALFPLVATAEAPPGVILAAALAIGLTGPQAAAMSRSRLLAIVAARIAPERRTKTTARLMSYESAADETAFVIGPFLVGILAALIAPWAPIAVAAALSFGFVLAFALHPTARLLESRAEAAAERAAFRAVLTPSMLVLVAATFGVGMFFGSALTSLTAFARAAGDEAQAGLLYGLMGIGSAVLALGVVLLPARFALRHRWLAFAGVLTAASVGYATSSSLGVVAGWLLVMGLGVGPTLVTLFSLAGERASRTIGDDHDAAQLRPHARAGARRGGDRLDRRRGLAGRRDGRARGGCGGRVVAGRREHRDRRRHRAVPAHPAADVAADEAWRRDGTDERARVALTLPDSAVNPPVRRRLVAETAGMTRDQYTFTDPAALYADIEPQKQRMPEPGLDANLTPRADLGEDTYRGTGRLRGRRALITGGDRHRRRHRDRVRARGRRRRDLLPPGRGGGCARIAGLIRDAGVTALTFPGDLTDAAYCRELVAKTVDGLGGLDILVNNGGKQIFNEDLATLSDEQFDATFKTNVYAMFWITKAALAHLAPGSAIINTTSIQAYKPSDVLVDYASTKATINAFTKALAQQVAPRGIRVNAVAPGPIWTALQPTDGQPQESWSTSARTRRSDAWASPPNSRPPTSSSRRPSPATSSARRSTSTAASSP
jgi:NAD(P)-dependent dehydrogenase (short-subunit alcohol dehydrogenase family)/MFS family permease